MATTLVLLRHAKSAYPPGVRDHDRPLNERGERDAPVAGELIAIAVGAVDVALVSTALRAQQTWELASAALEVGEVIQDPQMYLASPQTMLEQIRQVPGETVVVVAHNPGTEDLAQSLAGNVDDTDYRHMLNKFPTAAFAVLQAEVPLSLWEPGCARLQAFEVARG